MAEELAKQQKKTTLAQVKSMLDNPKTKARFEDILKQKAPQFMASITNVVNGSNQLKNCDATSIMSAAFVAASFDLPIDSNLGFSALVPYKVSYKDENGEWKKKELAQYQIMYKGFIQLAIRSGYYKKMNCTEVYEDELKSYNPILGECEFVEDFSQTKQRENGETDKVVGYYAWFELTTGFQKGLYMSKAEVTNHALKYSQAYRYDQDKNKATSNWSTNFNAMAKKTVIKLLLSKWGILSIQMQNAITEDQKTFDENGESDYGDNKPDTEEAVDPFKSTEVEDAEYEEIDITE